MRERERERESEYERERERGERERGGGGGEREERERERGERERETRPSVCGWPALHLLLLLHSRRWPFKCAAPSIFLCICLGYCKIFSKPCIPRNSLSHAPKKMHGDFLFSAPAFLNIFIHSFLITLGLRANASQIASNVEMKAMLVNED